MSAQTSDYGSTGSTASYGRERAVRTFTESKLGFKTSEFLVALVAMVAVLVATYADGDDTLTQNDGWRYAAWIAAAYIVSRGLAKLGVREPYADDGR
jgi:hypothetical protein